VSVAAPTLRDLERGSIRAFLEDHAEYFTGRVLDYGCGRKPYRELVTDAGAEYFGYDRKAWPANASGRDEGDDVLLHGSWDVVLSTQVLQYVPNPLEWIEAVRKFLRPGGYLVMTGPTNWPIVEREDRWRFTPTGIASLLNEAGFFVVTVEERASVRHANEAWLLGWGVVARS
jgi:SAM-dependent methyltransferase